MKHELTLWQRLKAPKPHSIKMLILLCVIVVLNVAWGRCLLFFNNQEPDTHFYFFYVLAGVAAGVGVGLLFVVDEDALKKKTVLDNIKKRVKNRQW